MAPSGDVTVCQTSRWCRLGLGVATTEKEVVDWLLGADVAVAFQTARDLLGQDRPDLRERIASEGQGAALLAARGANGHWGRGSYQPKWTSSHYTLLELKNLGLSPETEPARETVQLILRREKSRDGGLNPTATVAWSDACVNAMALGYSAYFGAEQAQLSSVVDFLLDQRVPDGGFNCQWNKSRRATTHSSVHTTLSVMEGVTEYLRRGYRYRADELAERHYAHGLTSATPRESKSPMLRVTTVRPRTAAVAAR